jgi:IS30 family transposase
MPAERTTMRQVREIVRLHQAGVSTRQIGIRIGVAASTVRLTLRRVSEAGLSGRAAIEQTDTVLEALLFSGPLWDCPTFVDG